MSEGGYRFVANARRGLAAAIPLGTAIDGNVLPVTLAVATDRGPRTTAAVNVRLHGPGNVAGLDTRQIIRTEPRANTTEFEPNYLAACDFDDPFLPWLFSPEQTHGKLKPWLVLVVVDRDAAPLHADPRRPLPWIELAPTMAADQLQDLSESWAWAHSQIAGTEAGMTDALTGPPESTLSRVLCSRRLRPSTAYRACLVPAYLAGAQVGRGESVTAAAGVPAWPAADVLRGQTEPLDLPVYHSWEFTTSVAGDFEALARRLRPEPLSPEIGGRPMDIAQTGLPPDEPGRVLALEGILGSPEMVPSEWPDPAKAEFQAALEQRLETPPDADDTVLAPPIYGGPQAGTDGEVPDAGAPLPWLRRLNLDPRFRVAAGLGTRVVQKLQEQLMASAWDQAGELERANELLRNAQVARATATAAGDKHLATLPADDVLRVTAPAHGRVRLGRDGTPAEDRPANDPKRDQTLLGGIADPESVFPPAAVAPPFRKVTRPGGPVGRHLPAEDQPTTVLTERLARGEVEVPILPAEGGADFDRVADDLGLPPDQRPSVDQAKEKLPNVQGGFTKVSARAIDGRSFYFDPTAPPEDEGARALAPPDPGGFEPPDEETPLRRERVRGINRRFKDAATFLLQKLPAPPPSPPTGGTLELGGVRDGLIGDGGVLDPDRTTAREVLPLVPPAPAMPGADPLRPRAAAPRFPQPMSEPLKAIDAQMLLPGAELIPPDSIGIAVTNARVLESYMAALSHEFSRELLWRGLPADLGATYFQQFWDVRGSGSQNGTNTTDIPPIDEWGADNDLGENATGVGGAGMLVLIVRGELLRRYPTTAVYAVKAVPKVDANGDPVLDGDGDPVPAPGTDELYPAFRGMLEPDLTYIGFGIDVAQARGAGADLGWFFVLQEQPTAPRFGLDEPPDAGPPYAAPATWADAHWGHAFPEGTDLSTVTHLPVAGPLDGVELPIMPGAELARWGAHSAAQAAIAFQRPVRVAIHARTMLPEVP
jgi:hypothetical protein